MIGLVTGIVGMFFILLAFILDEFYKWCRQDTVLYNSMNIVGSGLLSYYAFISNVWPFLILNMVWFVVAVVKLVEIVKKK